METLKEAIDRSVPAVDVSEYSDTEKISGNIFNLGFPCVKV